MSVGYQELICACWLVQCGHSCPAVLHHRWPGAGRLCWPQHHGHRPPLCQLLSASRRPRSADECWVKYKACLRVDHCNASDHGNSRLNAEYLLWFYSDLWPAFSHFKQLMQLPLRETFGAAQSSCHFKRHDRMPLSVLSCVLCISVGQGLCPSAWCDELDFSVETYSVVNMPLPWN